MLYNQGDRRNDPIYNKVRQNDNFNSNSYNPNARWNHPNFKWRAENDNSNQFQGNSNQYRSNQNSYQGPPQNSKLEKMIEDLALSQKEYIEYQRNTNTDVSNSLRNMSNRFELLETKTKMLETQIAQQASSSFRQQGVLPGKPDINPRENAKDITLRSGTGYEGPKMPSIEEPQQPPKETQPPPAPLNASTPASDTPQEPGNSNPAKVKSNETPKYIPPHRFIPFSSKISEKQT